MVIGSVTQVNSGGVLSVTVMTVVQSFISPHSFVAVYVIVVVPRSNLEFGILAPKVGLKSFSIVIPV